MRQPTGTVIKLKNDIVGQRKGTVGICIEENRNLILFPNGEFIEFNADESEDLLGVIGFAVPVSNYKFTSFLDTTLDFKKGIFNDTFMEYNSSMPIYNTIGNILIKLIRENRDYRDYDDENIIQLYKKMNLTEKLAVDNIIVYLSAHTLNEIITLYNNEM
jgi:hypothetical protein